MTVPASSRRAGPFSGNGVATAFPFTFLVFSAADIEVVLADADGVETVLTLSSDYTVTLNPDQNANPGGTVTYPISGAAMPALSTLTVVGSLDYEQTLDLPGGGNFSPTAIENALDRGVIQTQQLREVVDRTLRLPVSAAAASTELPPPNAGSVIGWNETADGLVNYDAASLATVVIAGTSYTDVFDGTGAQTVFTLTADPGSVNALDVAIGGVSQINGVDFTSSGVTLTFTTAPPAGTDNIAVRYVAAVPVGSVNAQDATYTPPGTGGQGTTVKAVLDNVIYADDYSTLQQAVVAAYGKTLVLTSGATYSLSSELQIDNSISITTTGAAPAVIEALFSGSLSNGIDIGGGLTDAAVTALAANAAIGFNKITVASASGILPGMLATLQSTKAWYHDPRTTSGITPSSDATGTATAGGASTITLKVGTVFTGFAGMAVTIESGTGKGQARVVQSYNSGTRVATMTTPWKTAPDATSVYRFPQLFKGELHLIREVSGNVLTLDAPLMDGYDVVDDTYGDGLEEVTVTVAQPIDVSIHNILLKRQAALNANTFGVRVRQTNGFFASGLRVESATAAGVICTASYRPEFERIRVTGANDTTTGYGIQFGNCTFPRVYDSQFWGCRRGVDLSGTTPTSFAIIERNECLGGGAQEDGTLYRPEGTIDNFGMGSHGTGRGTMYRNNVISNFGRGINLRGRDEMVIGNTFYGRFTTSCIDLAFGSNVTITGNTYRSLFQEGPPFDTAADGVERNSFEAANIFNRQAQYFVNIQSTWDRGSILVSNNECRELNRYFIFVDSASSEVLADLSLRNNTVAIRPNASGAAIGMIGTSAPSLQLQNFRDEGNSMDTPDSSTAVRRYGPNVSVNAAVGVVSAVGSPVTRTVLLLNDTVGQIRTAFVGSNIVILVCAQNSLTQRFFGAITVTTGALTSFGASNSVTGIGSVPTGTTGGAGTLNLHYDGQFLYLENRSGGSRDFFVTFFPAE